MPDPSLRLLPLLLAACTGSGTLDPVPGAGAGPDTDAPPPVASDTLPQFLGEVPSNLVVISIDTFRRDHAGKYAPGEMPFLEQVMNEGFTLDNHMECANWTFMGTACTVNGRHNEENGFIPELGVFRAPLPDGPTLASALGDHGFYSVLATGNSWFSLAWNNAQGYDESQLLGGGAVNIGATAVELLEAAQERGEASGRWMLHMHLMEPHAPYAPPEEYLVGEADLAPLPGAWDLSDKGDHYAANATWPTLSPEEQAALEAHMRFRYAAELRWLDDQLAVIWADLDSRGLLEDALVVIFNDHGEQIFEHGRESHAWGLYREENDGIFAMWAKNIVPGAWSGPTSQIDLAPTVLGLLGAEIPAEMTGVKLGESEPDRPLYALTSARQGTVQSVRQNDRKMIFNWTTGAVEVYDLLADPGEQTNVFDAADPVSLALWELLVPRIELAEPVVLDEEPIWPASLPR